MVYTTQPWRPLVTKVDLKIELAILTSVVKIILTGGTRYSHQWYKIFSPVVQNIITSVVKFILTSGTR